MRLSEHVRELRPHAESEAIKIIAQAGLGGGVITIAYRIVGSHLATVGWGIAFLVSAALFGISLWMPRSRRVPNASIEQGGTQLRTPNGLRRCASVLAEYCWVSAPLQTRARARTGHCAQLRCDRPTGAAKRRQPSAVADRNIWWLAERTG